MRGTGARKDSAEELSGAVLSQIADSLGSARADTGVFSSLLAPPHVIRCRERRPDPALAGSSTFSFCPEETYNG